MANIEIYGKRRNIGSLENSIITWIQNAGLEEETVVTMIESSSRPCGKDGRLVCHIRVCSPDIEEIQEVVQVLRENRAGMLGLSVETLILSSFIPKEEMS
ncbi:hypothetical protein ACFLZC_02035 [Patescibacteria group bacterium]